MISKEMQYTYEDAYFIYIDFHNVVNFDINVLDFSGF